MRSLTLISLVGSLAVLTLAGCHDDHENTGHACTAVDQCYPGVDQASLLGAVVCMDRVVGGYCTHQCVVDTDCCAVAGECETGFPQACAPFESTGDRYCFLSCEGVADEATYCQDNADPAFGCRSTGGGSDNRKVCVP
ncbi:MAG: hypothetical protein HY906_28100 [Deltaproteobacteria bacterium]|nr:hypothetical protein [Deltaproteobacteria bacterium]